MTLIRVLALAIVGLMVWPSTMAAQEPDDEGSGRGRRRRRGPDQIQQRIDQLREEGVAEDDPRLERMEQMLERMQQGDPRDKRRRGRAGGSALGEFGGFGSRQYSPEEMLEFVQQHDKLRKLFVESGEGEGASSEFMRRAVRRSGRQISEIMTATEQGQEDFARVLIESAAIQFQIRDRIGAYHTSPRESAERDAIRDVLADLVRRQVATDLVVQEFKLGALRERLAEQEARLAKDRNRQEELASRKLERLLSGQRQRMGEGGRRRPFEGRRGRGGRDFDRRREPER